MLFDQSIRYIELTYYEQKSWFAQIQDVLIALIIFQLIALYFIQSIAFAQLILHENNSIINELFRNMDIVLPAETRWKQGGKTPNSR